MAKRAKMTVGEKLAVAAYPLTEFTRNFDVYAKRSSLARRIDAAINRAAWDGFHYGDKHGQANGGGTYYEAVAMKYGPSPAKKVRKQ